MYNEGRTQTEAELTDHAETDKFLSVPPTVNAASEADIQTNQTQFI